MLVPLPQSSSFFLLGFKMFYFSLVASLTSLRAYQNEYFSSQTHHLSETFRHNTNLQITFTLMYQFFSQIDSLGIHATRGKGKEFYLFSISATAFRLSFFNFFFFSLVFCFLVTLVWWGHRGNLIPARIYQK